MREPVVKQVTIPYEFSREFADTWADVNALYHTIDLLESRVWGLVKWMRHSLNDQEYQVMQMRYSPHSKGGRMTLERVGQRMNLTKERVRQIEAQALASLGITLYKTSIIYGRGGYNDRAGKRGALSARKQAPLHG